MTCYRKPGSVEALLQQTMRALPHDDIEKITGLAISNLYKMANPNTRHTLPLAVAARLDALRELHQLPPVFSALYEREYAEAKAEIWPDHGSLWDAAARMNTEMAEDLELLGKSLRDGVLSPDEHTALSAEASETLAHAQQYVALVAAHAPGPRKVA